MIKDVYDQEIEYLMENPEMITPHWHANFGPFSSDKIRGGPSLLFQHCTPSGTSEDKINVGCLTQIRSYKYCFVLDHNGIRYDLTERIKNDIKIPLMVDKNTNREQLEVFRDWQRKLDTEIRPGVDRTQLIEI